MSMTESSVDLASQRGWSGQSAEMGNQEAWTGRMPPQDDHAEQSVLGAMLISKDAIADVNEHVSGTDLSLIHI